MIHDIAESLLASLQAVAGRSITYRRGSAAVALTAVPGVTQFEVASGSQYMEELRSRDFLFFASELILSGVRTEPQRLDTIDETVNGVTQSYEVNAPGPGQCFRYSDSAKTIVRVFTRRIS
jgi:hypothetical protein